MNRLTFHLTVDLDEGLEPRIDETRRAIEDAVENIDGVTRACATKKPPPGAIPTIKYIGNAARGNNVW